jgi:hypothetical protein
VGRGGGNNKLLTPATSSYNSIFAAVIMNRTNSNSGEAMNDSFAGGHDSAETDVNHVAVKSNREII